MSSGDIGRSSTSANLYRATLAYDGSGFEGFQLQAEARRARTVQGEIESALRRLAGRGVRVVAAGRTDAGVHALGQVVSFELPSAWEPRALARALNAHLPADVRALDASAAPVGFHARKSATSKLYRYLLDVGPVQLPTRRRLAGHTRHALEAERVAAAAALFAGRRDFASLRSSGGSARTTVRTILSSEARFEPAPEGGGRTLVYEVEADGFLRKMVRSLVGGLVAAGRGALSLDDLRRALEARDRRAWPPPAPACGLYLVRVTYPAEPVLA